MHTLTQAEAQNVGLVWASDYIADTKTHHAGSGVDDGENQYYPDVTFWVAFEADGGTATFDAGSTLLLTSIGADAPQSGETIVSGQIRSFGPITAFKFSSLTRVRAIRGK